MGIQIYRDLLRGILGLSQKAYIEKVFNRYGMQNCLLGDTCVAKGYKFRLQQCPKHELEIKEMQKIPLCLNCSAKHLMYAQICTYLDIPYIVGIFCRYLSNPRLDHSKVVKTSYVIFAKNKGIYVQVSEI